MNMSPGKQESSANSLIGGAEDTTEKIKKEAEEDVPLIGSKKSKTRALLAILLPVITVVFIAIYARYKYTHSTKSTRSIAESGAEQNDTHDVQKKKLIHSVGQVVSSLEKVDRQMQDDRSYLSSMLGVYLKKGQESDVGQKIAISSFDQRVVGELSALINGVDVAKFSGDPRIGQIMMNIVKYNELLVLKEQISGGIDYMGRLGVVEAMSGSDQDLFGLVSVLKNANVYSDAQIYGKYQAVASTIYYEDALHGAEPTKLTIFLLKIKRYVGIRKAGVVDVVGRLDLLMSAKKYEEALALINEKSFSDEKIVSFKKDLSRTVEVDKAIFDAQKAIVGRLAKLTDVD